MVSVKINYGTILRSQLLLKGTSHAQKAEVDMVSVSLFVILYLINVLICYVICLYVLLVGSNGAHTQL